MKKIGMLMAMLLAFSLLLTACESNIAKGKDGSEASAPAVAMVKTGLATVNTMAVSDDALTAKTVAAAVAVGKDGRITACKLDEIETDAKLKTGKITREKDMRSKYAQGDDYGLATSAPLSKEWYKQVDALCDYVVGKTAAEVADISLENGVAADETLRSRCELTITPFIEVIGKACDMATQRGAQAGDALSLSMTATDATGGSDKAVQTDVHVAAVALNSRGVVTDCLVDVASCKVDVTDGAFSGITGPYRSKKDQKTGMDDTSDTEKDAEWAACANAFEEYVIGKTARQVKVTPLTDGKPASDTELSKKCTIRVTEMMDNVLKAIDTASAEGTAAKHETETAADGFLEDVVSVADDVVSQVEDAVSRVGEELTESR